MENDNTMFPPPPTFQAQANISSMAAYHALCDAAKKDPEQFWSSMAKTQLHWHKPFTQVLNESGAPFYKWFEDGELNVSYNCLDVHVSNGNADKTAIIFESDEGKVTSVTYRQLYEQVCKFANGLRALGIKKGECVIIYMPMSIEAVVAMQACARIGATHSVVFAGFSVNALKERILDTVAVAVITADYQMRGGKTLPIKSVVDEAIADETLITSVRNVIVNQRTDEAVNWNSRDIWMHDLVKTKSAECEPEWVDAEHPLFVLYTSGSTGKPKGVQHSSAGYLLWVKQTMQWVFDIKPNDIFWCTADIGWVTGHSYSAYGPLAAGATIVLFEGIPTHPDASRFWRIIEKHRVTIFYTAPTAIRTLIKANEVNPATHPNQFDLSCLRLLGSVGEPINPAAWRWYYTNVGREQCPIVDTYWQTETGGIVISPLPGATPLAPGSCTLPLPGIECAVVDEHGHDVPNGQGGTLVIKRPWPSMLRTIWKNPARYKKGYFPDELGGHLYLAGDGAIRDANTGYITITGRIDDVLNVSGHRLGTAEIESALVANGIVAEAAVVAKPDDTTGEAICAFVVLKRARPTGDEARQIATQLRDWVALQISAIAKPKEIRFGDNLPKTRSGKIMRRLLRTIAKGEAITQDVTTLENPAILEQLNEEH